LLIPSVTGWSRVPEPPARMMPFMGDSVSARSPGSRLSAGFL
jgi:hypothetical protein